LWAGGILSAYYVVQKPGLLNAFTGLADTLWTLIVATLLLFNAYGIGTRILSRLGLKSIDEIDRLLLGCGIGLGGLGLLGLGLSAVRLARAPVFFFLIAFLTAFFVFSKDLGKLRIDLKALATHLNLSFSQFSLFSKIAIVLPILFSSLLTLVPPFEAFDALLYHLALPATILRNGGLQAVDNTPFWFPSLSENVYLWALGMGSERAAQMIHFAWMLLSTLLLWNWASKIWNTEVARKTLLLLAAVPSLTMLVSWAYADMALVYYATAAMYAFTQYRIIKASSWLSIAGLMAGFAMGIKYTSFVVPLTCGLLLLFRRPFSKSILSAAQFSLITLATACPWYIRNAIFMGNPFYPFIFGGRYWDSFLTQWYADAGTGIGWNMLQIIQLPLNAILGTQDMTFFDGRMGPLFLILAPMTIWILWTRTRQDTAQGWSLFVIGVFSLLSFVAWTLGVINSSGLWQARLLFPALIPFTIPTALAWDSLKQFDTSRLRISFLVHVLIGIVIVLTIFDNGIFVLQRNPLAVAFGAQSRERYIERINPSYAALIDLMDDLPVDARVYSLFEPRSYGLPRSVQADPLLYNFAHDVYLFHTSNEIIQHWKLEKFTNVFVYERGLALTAESASIKFSPQVQQILQETLGQLELISQTPDKVYSIYRIP
jgi:hypothetical protein